MTLSEINNSIKNYKNIIIICKEKNLHYASEYYRVKLKTLETERKEILKSKENA